MAAIDTDDDVESRADACSAGDPPPRKRRKPLNSLEDVRAEMTRIYWALRHDEMPQDKGKTLVYVLGQVVQVFKAEQSGEGELAALLNEVRERLKK